MSADARPAGETAPLRERLAALNARIEQHRPEADRQRQVQAQQAAQLAQALIECAHRSAKAMGADSAAALVRDVLRICYASDAGRTAALQAAASRLDPHRLAELQQLDLPDTDPAAMAAQREAAFDALRQALPMPTDAARRKRDALLHRAAWLAEAAHVARRDWAQCARSQGCQLVVETGARLVVQVKCPGVLVLTWKSSAALVARSLPGRLAELDRTADPD